MDVVEAALGDPDLLRRARAGDAAAWSDLVRAHEPALTRLAAAIVRDDEDARDVCQETLRRAIAQLPALDDAERFDLWIRRIAVNAARDVLRRRGVRHAVADELARMPPRPARPEDLAVAREDRDRLRRALDRLPMELREALVAHLVEDRDYRELAAILDLTVNAVRIRVHRALARLRELLKEQP